MVRQRSRKKETLPDPQRFNLESFAAILPRREAIVGEDAGSWGAFQISLRQSLNPGTPYEAVIAENLVQIEWELLQHRAMREARIRRLIRSAIRKAVREQKINEYDRAMNEAYNRHLEQGENEGRWNRPYEFDENEVEASADQLVDRATSRDPKVQAAAYAEISELGLSALDLMSEAHRGALGGSSAPDDSPEYHDTKIRELERRRREVKRDYDLLQQSRPQEEVIIEQ